VAGTRLTRQAVQVVVAVVHRATAEFGHRKAMAAGVEQVAVAREAGSTLGDAQVGQPVAIVVAIGVRHAVRICEPGQIPHVVVAVRGRAIRVRRRREAIQRVVPIAHACAIHVRRLDRLHIARRIVAVA